MLQFEKKRKQNVDAYEERTRKRAEKRKRKKLKKQELQKADKQQKRAHGECQDKPSQEDDTPLPTPGGVAAIPNDGSFLEMMLKKKQEGDASAKAGQGSAS